MNPLLRIQPLSLYVHLPWCVAKCPYCDFNSHAIRKTLPEQRYVRALVQDLEIAAEAAAGRSLISVFFGGGTPSLFQPASIARILDAVRNSIGLPPAAEVTLEANPGTVEHGRFAEYRATGVNRLSLGIQSFNNRHLATLGRIHGRAETFTAVEEARSAGFENFNLDLMYGLPGQTPVEAGDDIETAVSLEPTHISHYQLTLEPNTLFHAHPPANLPEDEPAWQMQDAACRWLHAAGFEQYETSAYARPGHRCVHTLNYWRYGDYLGIGAGAHGKFTLPEDDLIMRNVRYRHPQIYMGKARDGIPTERSWSVDTAERGFEYVLNSLRLVAGTTPAAFAAATGVPAATLKPQLDRARCLGLMESGPGRWRATALGRNHLNVLQALFLPDDRRPRPRFPETGARGHEPPGMNG